MSEDAPGRPGAGTPPVPARPTPIEGKKVEGYARHPLDITSSGRVRIGQHLVRQYRARHNAHAENSVGLGRPAEIITGARVEEGDDVSGEILLVYTRQKTPPAGSVSAQSGRHHELLVL